MTQKIGILRSKGNNWQVDSYEFTVNERENPWVVRNLRIMAAKSQEVIVRVDEHRRLLSVRVK